MATARAKKCTKQLGAYFIKKGKILTEQEYIAAKDQPVLGSAIKLVFGSYARMVSTITNNQALMALIAQSEALQKEKPVVEEVAPSPTISALEKLKKTTTKLELPEKDPS